MESEGKTKVSSMQTDVCREQVDQEAIKAYQKRQPSHFRQWWVNNIFGWRRVHMRGGGSSQVIAFDIFGASVILEKHEESCTCSYCGGSQGVTRRYGGWGGEFGLELPENKSKGSWRILHWPWRKSTMNLRWTLPSIDFRRLRYPSYDDYKKILDKKR